MHSLCAIPYFQCILCAQFNAFSILISFILNPFSGLNKMESKCWPLNASNPGSGKGRYALIVPVEKMRKIDDFWDFLGAGAHRKSSKSRFWEKSLRPHHSCFENLQSLWFLGLPWGAPTGEPQNSGSGRGRCALIVPVVKMDQIDDFLDHPAGPPHKRDACIRGED